MRVIAGKYKGHNLVGFKASNIRPTTDRVKESVFNILGDQVDSSRILDLFSGTGSLAAEALSRGAAEVVSVEKHSKSIEVMKSNKSKLKIAEEWKIIKGNVFTYIKRYEGAPFHVILIDPPFTEKLADKMMEEISLSAVWGPETVVFIESSKHEKIGDHYGALECVDRRGFGDKLASFFKERDENEKA